MNVYITSATPFEVQPLKDMVDKKGLQHIHFHISGVGILQSCFSVQKLITGQSPDFLIQIGIAGTFDEHCLLGDVVIVKNDIPGSCGVEENDQWQDIFDMNLANKNVFPFCNKSLTNPALPNLNLLGLREVNAITVDEITTDKNRIARLKNKYDPFLESMEGASLHYCALQYNIPFLQVRGISNYIGERNRQNWKIKEAIQNVCKVSFDYINRLRS